MRKGKVEKICGAKIYRAYEKKTLMSGDAPDDRQFSGQRKIIAGTELQNAEAEYADAKVKLNKEIEDSKKAARADEALKRSFGVAAQQILR